MEFLSRLQRWWRPKKRKTARAVAVEIAEFLKESSPAFLGFGLFCAEQSPHASQDRAETELNWLMLSAVTFAVQYYLPEREADRVLAAFWGGWEYGASHHVPTAEMLTEIKRRWVTYRTEIAASSKYAHLSAGDAFARICGNEQDGDLRTAGGGVFLAVVGGLDDVLKHVKVV